MKETVVNFSPAWLSHHRTITLWDMITCEPGKLAAQMLSLTDYHLRLKEVAERVGYDREIDSGTKQRLNELIVRMLDNCQVMQLKVATSRADAINLKLGGLGGRCTYDILDSEIEAFSDVVREEIYGLSFVYLPTTSARLVDQSSLFGEVVGKAFPSAALDIKEAGNCVAVGLNTAAVFHLMRVVEFGLRALASDLNITSVGKRTRRPLDLAMWDEVIWKIEENIGKKLRTKAPLSTAPKTGSRNRAGAAKRERTKLHYRGILHEFLGFKDVWRNYVMHTHHSYKEEEAIALLARVREFMQRLATKNF